MARPGPRKPSVTVRLSPDTLTAVDVYARRVGLIRKDGDPNRSAAIEQIISTTMAVSRFGQPVDVIRPVRG